MDRYGSIINQAQTAFLTPTAFVNLSAQYRLGNAAIGVAWLQFSYPLGG